MKVNSDDYLVGHYNTLGNLDKDFRNLNLFRLSASLVNGHTVIDIGCGDGFFVAMLKKYGKEVIGIEPSDGMRELATKINPEVKVISGMAEDIDILVKNPVDSVTMLDVLEHIEDDGNQLKKVHSILKAEGEFIIVVPAHPFLYGLRDMHMGHYRRYSKKSITDLLNANGFAIKYIRYWNALGIMPYFVSEKILKKPLQVDLRKSSETGLLGQTFQKGLYFWFRLIENNFNFGFGLSLIIVAKKI